MIGVAIGFGAGYLAGMVMFALLRMADEPEEQIPTLGQGSWLVQIDRWGQMTRCESHVCFEASVRRLLDEEQA